MRARIAQMLTPGGLLRYPGSMTEKHTNRGIITCTLLLTAAAAAAGYSGGLSRAPHQDPAKQLGPNPAQQRIDMIAHLQAIEEHMASVDRNLKSLERAASVALQMQIKGQKAKDDAGKETPPAGG